MINGQIIVSNCSSRSNEPRFGVQVNLIGKANNFEAHLWYLVFAVVVPLIGLTCFLLYRTTTEALREIERQLIHEAMSLAQALDQEVDRVVVQLKMIGEMIADRSDLRVVHDAARVVLLPVGYNFIIYDSSAQQLVNAAIPLGTPLVWSGQPDYVESAVTDGKPTLSDLTRTIMGPIVSLDLPIERASEKLILRMTIADKRLHELAEHAVTRREAFVRWGVSDRAGNLVARSHEHDRFVGTPLPQELRVSSAGLNGVHWVTSLDSTPIVRAWARTDSNWLVAVAVPQTKVIQLLWVVWVGYTAIVAAVFLLTYAVTRAIAHRLTREVHTLRCQAAAIGRPNLSPAGTFAVAEFAMISHDLQLAAESINASEQRRKMLVQELEHRAKNLLSIALSLVRRVLRGSPDLERARMALDGRLKALADGTHALAEGGWLGADLKGIVDTAMRPFEGQHQCSGPDIALRGHWAVNLSLILHELATNSAKYGALSVPDGRVLISWSVNHDFVFRWQERCGPDVRQTTRVGFGTQLIKSMSIDPSLPPTVEYAADGLRYELRGPSDIVVLPRTLRQPIEFDRTEIGQTIVPT